MNWNILGPLLATAIVTILGWLVAHRFSASRDRLNRRAEERLGHLVAAYQTLSQIRGHDYAWELGEDIRVAVADIQLFGTVGQIKHTVQWIHAATAKENIAIDELDALLESLRGDLREELGMKPVGDKIWWVKIGPPKEKG